MIEKNIYIDRPSEKIIEYRYLQLELLCFQLIGLSCIRLHQYPPWPVLKSLSFYYGRYQVVGALAMLVLAA